MNLYRSTTFHRPSPTHWREGDNRTTKGCFPGAGIFTKTDITPTALVSFPGSGNSWTRHLLTTATGILTGTVYNVGDGVFVNMNRAKRVIAVKTHSTPQNAEHEQKFKPKRAIVIIRNPYEAFLAEFNRQAGGHAIVRNRQSFVREWPKYLSPYLRQWKEIYLSWAKFGKPLHVLVYHRLVENLETELKLAIHFLNESLILPHLHCALDAPEGNYHRQKPDWLKEAAKYTASQIQTLNNDIDEVQKAFESLLHVEFSDFQRWKR